jgi:hypothetical protein
MISLRISMNTTSTTMTRRLLCLPTYEDYCEAGWPIVGYAEWARTARRHTWSGSYATLAYQLKWASWQHGIPFFTSQENR